MQYLKKKMDFMRKNRQRNRIERKEYILENLLAVLSRSTSFEMSRIAILRGFLKK